MIQQYADLYLLKLVLYSKVFAATILGISFALIFDPGAFSIILVIIIIACILFVPYMLYVLYISDKKSWITGFIILMFVSFVPLIFFNTENIIPKFLLNYLPLINFLLYCWFLNQKAGEWIFENHYWRSHQ